MTISIPVRSAGGYLPTNGEQITILQTRSDGDYVHILGMTEAGPFARGFDDVEPVIVHAEPEPDPAPQLSPVAAAMARAVGLTTPAHPRNAPRGRLLQADDGAVWAHDPDAGRWWYPLDGRWFEGHPDDEHDLQFLLPCGIPGEE
jgi:hypothetical protein